MCTKSTFPIERQVHWPGSEANESLQNLSAETYFCATFFSSPVHFFAAMFMGVTTSIIVLNDYLQ